MPKNKAIVLIAAIVVMIIGFFVGTSHLEGKVNALVKDFIAKTEDISAESFTFSMPSRRLVINNATYTVFEYESEKDIRVVSSYEKIDLVLPWSIFLYDGESGATEVAESLTIKNVTTKAYIPYGLGKEELIATAALTTYNELSMDIPLFIEVLQGKDLEKNEILYMESAQCEFGKIENMTISGSLMNPVKLNIGKIEMQDINGFALALFDMQDIDLFFVEEEKTEPVFTLETFSLHDVSISSEFMTMLMELDPMEPDLAMDEWIKLLSSAHPFVKKVNFKNLQLLLEDAPITVKSFDLNWPSNTPFVINTVSETTLPASLIENELSLRLPHLKTLEFAHTLDIKTDETGKRVQQDSYKLKDLAQLDTTSTLILEKGLLSMVLPPNDIASLPIFDGTDIQYTDTGLLSYIFLNVGLQSSQQAIASLAFLPSKNSEKGQKLIADLTAFLEKPGTLTIGLHPEKPISISELQETLLIDPYSILNVTATPGKKSLNEAIQALSVAQPE